MSFPYQRQLSNTPLTPQEQFAIGNRWTVRGFDGERTLNASNGWYIRNDLAWRTPLPEQELYLGMDYGEVGGPGHVLNGDNTDENKQPNLGKDVASATDKDKAELGGAGAGTPGGWGPDNEEKARHQEVQQQRFDELSKIYDKSHPVGELTVDGQTIRQSSVSNRYGTTKVFESQNLTDKQIHNYAQQLAGDTPLKEVRPGIYTAKLNNGTSITLRNLSSSQEQTGARWTIDIRGNQQLAEIAHKYGRQVEIKFR